MMFNSFKIPSRLAVFSLRVCMLAQLQAESSTRATASRLSDPASGHSGAPAGLSSSGQEVCLIHSQTYQVFQDLVWAGLFQGMGSACWPSLFELCSDDGFIICYIIQGPQQARPPQDRRSACWPSW